MKRVILAMSGGVDSSVAAYLLQQEGWEVVGVTLDLWPGAKASDAAEGARRVCEHLGIPHRSVNCREEFRRVIVEEFRDEYFRGRTPNPCVRCNPRIKFKKLLELATDLSASAVATGHYAIVGGPEPSGRFFLLKGRDVAKEQSYLLCGLTQEHLARCRLPLGAWEKRKVRALARELDLPTRDEPDSQEICFVPNDDYGDFLAQIASDRIRPGRLVDTSGKFLGRHRGIHLFTIGQRRKLGVAVGEPRYVVRIEPDTATIVLGTREETFSATFTVRDVNWLAIENPAAPLEAEVKIRYTHRPASARVEPLPGERAARVTFASRQSAITPGQAAVFYRRDLVLGGGTIDEVLGSY